MLKVLGSVFFVAVLSACGGGGSGGGGGDQSSVDTSPMMVKTVVTFTDSTYTSFPGATPSAQSIPANSVSGLFTTTLNTLSNGSVTFSATPISSGQNSPLTGYYDVAVTMPEFSRFTTGGAALWPRARFGTYSTARKTTGSSNTIEYIDMPYIAVNQVPATVSSGTYSGTSGRAIGVLASSTRFPWMRCNASATMSVAESTRTVVLTLANCGDSYDTTGTPSGNPIPVINPTITLTTSDNATFKVTGNPTFTFGVNPPLNTFTPTTFRGDFKLAGTLSATEIVGRVYMTDGNGVHGTFAFGVTQ
ncbi:MAG: hypothetical protein QE265_13120 [Rhodoferax sp.]|nr:hypothetical protein [Rhodoferax sp.]